MGLLGNLYQHLCAAISFSTICCRNTLKIMSGTNAFKPKKMGSKIAVLGNGNSQHLFWDNIKEFEGYDLLCVNYFPVFEEFLFFKYKPKFYCLIDPGAYDSFADSREEIRKLKTLFDKVDWPMFIISYDNQVFRTLNPFIGSIKLNSCRYDGNIKRLKEYLWKNNYASTLAYNVIIAALYYSVTFGYEEIALFGADFDYFNQFKVDEDGKVGDVQYHSYHENECHTRTFDSFYYDALVPTVTAYKGFVEIAEYAKSCGARIINYNLYSFIDVFEKSKRFINER